MHKSIPMIGRDRNPESGATLIEVLIATLILIIGTLSIMGVVAASIATNNRNKIESTGTMLAQSVVEQIKATIIGSGSSSLTDCAGTTFTINTATAANGAPAGAAVSGSYIDFTETNPPANYHMDFVVRNPCVPTGVQIRTYDVRWNVEVVGAPAAPTNTYLITVGARLKGHSEGNLIYPPAINFRVLAGN